MTLIPNTAVATTPKLARELKQRLADLLNRYTFEEVLLELAKAKPKMDIYICAAGEKRNCQRCGAEQC